MEHSVKAPVTNGGKKVSDAQDTWMQNLSDMKAHESREDDASSTSDLGDPLEGLENGVN